MVHGACRVSKCGQLLTACYTYLAGNASILAAAFSACAQSFAHADVVSSLYGKKGCGQSTLAPMLHGWDVLFA